MAETKHTPGPWELLIGKGSKSGTYSGNYEITAAIDGEHEANARLIAAAPELLVNLQQLIKFIELTAPGTKDSLIVVNARAAIAKATGA